MVRMVTPQESPKKKSGFTLIELLVVISIIAILSAIGLVSYNNIRGSALKARYQSDLNAIKKAYESNYDPTLNGGQGGYKPLTGANFANGSIPTPSGGTSSYLVTAPDASAISNNTQGTGAGAFGPNFSACINTTNGSSCSSSSPNCSCVSSNQGTAINPSGGNGGTTCDPFGALRNGLIAYWDIESPGDTGAAGSTVSDVSGDANILNGIVSAGSYGNASSANHIVNSNESFYTGKSLIGAGPPPTYNASFITTSNDPATTTYSGVTLSTWVKLGTAIPTSGGTKTGNNARVISKNGIYELILLSNGQVQLYINNTSAGIANASPILTTGGVNNTGWYHIAAVYNRSASPTVQIYVNDVLVGLSSGGTYSTPINTASATIAIGNQSGGSWPLVDSYIDKVRIYNIPLAKPAIDLLYNSGNGC